MNKTSHYEDFLTLGKNKIFYIHMSILAFIITEVKGEGSGLLYVTVMLTAMGCMLYGLFASFSYDSKITKIHSELREKGVWKDSFFTNGDKLTIRKFSKILPLAQPLYAQSIIGFLLFSYYLYITEAIPSSFFSHPSGWIQFIGLNLLAIFILILRASVPYAESTSFQTRLFTRNVVMNPISMLIYLIGQLPVPAMILHILIRYSTDSDLSIGDSIFRSEYHYFAIFYIAYMNNYLFERIKFKGNLKSN